MAEKEQKQLAEVGPQKPQMVGLWDRDYKIAVYYVYKNMENNLQGKFEKDLNKISRNKKLLVVMKNLVNMG